MKTQNTTTTNCTTPRCHVTINLKSYLTDLAFNDCRVISIMKIVAKLRREARFNDKELWDLWQRRKHQPNFNLPKFN